MFNIFQVVSPSSTLHAGRNLRYREVTRHQVVQVGLNAGHLALGPYPHLLVPGGCLACNGDLTYFPRLRSDLTLSCRDWGKQGVELWGLQGEAGTQAKGGPLLRLLICHHRRSLRKLKNWHGGEPVRDELCRVQRAPAPGVWRSE